MNGWALGGLACILYALIVGWLATKKSPGLIKLVKLKMGKSIANKTAITISFVVSAIMGLVGIILIEAGAAR